MKRRNSIQVYDYRERYMKVILFAAAVALILSWLVNEVVAVTAEAQRSALIKECQAEYAQECVLVALPVAI